MSNTDTGFFRPIPMGGDSLIVFRYTGRGFVPSRIEAHPLQDASAITFLGAELADRYPVLRSWKVPPPSTVSLDSLVTHRGPYRPLARIGLAAAYPIFEAYKDRACFGLRAEASDPFAMHSIDASASYSPDAGLPARERLHLAAGYRRYNLTARARLNGASFYDFFGPTKTSRKGYGASLAYTRRLLDDAPRSIELTATVDGYGGLERLPDAQNVSTSPGVDKLLDSSVQLAGKHLRASIGAVEYEQGTQWKLIAGTNGVRFVRQGDARWRGFPNVLGSFDVGAPLPLPNSSLWLRTAGGYSPGQRSEPFANFFFGGFGNNWIDSQDPKRYRATGSFPGVGLDALAGTNFARGMLDWNLPPLHFRRLGTLSCYGVWARMSLFTSALATNLDDAASRQRVADAGAQADVRFQLLTLQPLTLSAGYARAFRRSGTLSDEWMVSLKLL